MRASEFAFNEGKASRRKQASMNAKRRMANAQQVSAPAAEPTASTGTSAPAVAPQATSQVTPQKTDWAGLNKAISPNQPQAGSSMMGNLKQKAMSVGKGIANKFSTQGKVSARTDQIFMDKFLKDMATAEQTSTGLRGEPFDVKTWVNKYLAQNKWDAGEQQTALDSAIASNNKKAIAKAMAAIGKYNNLGSTISAKTAGAQANISGVGAMNQMATQLTQPATSKPTVQVSLGGKPGQPNTLDPTDPVDAKILSMLKQQGKI